MSTDRDRVDRVKTDICSGATTFSVVDTGQASGSNGVVIGDGNDVTGNENGVTGNGNAVTGNNNNVSGDLANYTVHYF